MVDEGWRVGIMFQMGTNMQRPKGGRGYRILKERLELQAKPKQGCLVGQVRDDAILQLLDNTDCFKQGSYMIRLVYFRKFTLWARSGDGIKAMRLRARDQLHDGCCNPREKS